MADILGAPIEHHAQASGSLGIAFLAAYATGQVSNFDAIRDAWLVDPEISIPDQARAGPTTTSTGSTATSTAASRRRLLCCRLRQAPTRR
ncbi:MAG: hypothetical protein NT169_25045 [Chloroflexi bacterium]|nr:hypothetical protein [Chloroflexota bacterium]